MKPIRLDTPTNVLIAAMEHIENASDVLVIVVKDKDEDHETHKLLVNESMTLATAAWLLESCKIDLYGFAKDGGRVDGD